MSMKGINGTICLVGICLLAHQGAASYPTLEQAQSLFSATSLDNPDIDMYRDSEYRNFLNNLFSQRGQATEQETIRMKNFLLATMTSIVVRVSTNVVDDGTATYPLSRDRGAVFGSAFRSFGNLFATNVTDCLTVADYIGQVRGVPFSESLIRRRSSVFFYSLDPKKREEWLEKQRAHQAHEKPIRELQMRVSVANGNVRDYRRSLFQICNACVLANRRVMGDDDFAAFTNRVVELSKPDDDEKWRLFDHLDEVKRK